MWKWLAIFSICGLISFSVYLYSHLGLSQPVEILTGEAGPYILLYKDHRGPYHQISPIISEVEKWAASNNVPCSQTFGEYLDDPESVDEDRLRSLGGCIVTNSPQMPLPEGFKIKEIAKKKYVIAHYKGSPAISPFTVYPKVKKFMNENRLKPASTAMEIYFVNGAQVSTEYLFELPE